MLSINVTDPTIQALLLQQVIATIETQKGFDELLHAGCSQEFLDTIRRREARDLSSVAKSLKTMRFSISTKEVMSQLQHLDRRRRDDVLQEYFVKHGASRNMLNDYFKMSGDEVQRMREVLLPDGAGQAGRTSLPTPSVRDQVHQAWGAINKQFPDEPQREQFYRLHQQFPVFSIRALDETVNEFDGKGTASRSAVHAALATRPISIARKNLDTPFVKTERT